MKFTKTSSIILILLISFPLIYILAWKKPINSDPTQYGKNQKLIYGKGPGGIPADWFLKQRAFPGAEVDVRSHREAVRQVLEMRAAYPQSDEVVWQEAGPSNIGGRLTAVSAHPDYPDTVFVGAAAGGVLRSYDAGDSWTPVFDETGVLPVGAVIVDPNDYMTIWAGTGEANSAADNYPGDGIYKSEDGGDTWTHKGLEYSSHIGRIAVDPSDSDIVFAAVMGSQWGTNPERGVYRTEDGGLNWERVLYLTDSTGCTDIVIHPQNPDTIYAAMWERIRHPDARNVGGVTSGIWRSVDGGDNWEHLTNGLPPAAPDVGRIGISIANSRPEILYAMYCDHPGEFMGIWRTLDNGDTWEEINGPPSSFLGGFGWYFGGIVVDPNDFRKVFALGVTLRVTEDGGQDWNNASGEMHPDHHGLWIDPNNSDLIYDGNDGGFYVSTNGGEDWVKKYDLHVTQFYAIEIDYQNPQRLYGGTQDNGTLRTLTGALDDWNMIYGGDGFYTLVDYSNPDIIFAEYQWGGLGKSTDGGYDFNYALEGVDGDDRRNWSTPVVMDPVNPEIMYYGTYRVYKSTDQAEYWTAVSPDLTNGPPAGYTYHTMTTIAVGLTNNSIIYAGTDDGNVWISMNQGDTWDLVSQALPERWVTRVAVSPQDAAVAYATFSGNRWDEYTPHVFRTTDYGTNWEDISGDMPQTPVTSIIEDPMFPNRLFVGTDVGVFYTENLGLNWYILGTELPISGIHDLKLHPGTRTLVAGTHGRSMYKTELDSIVVSVEKLDEIDTPESFVLYPATPNPFNSTTNIVFSLNDPSNIRLTVFDVQGREVAELANGNYIAGKHSIRFDARNLTTGIYFARLQKGSNFRMQRLVLVK